MNVDAFCETKLAQIAITHRSSAVCSMDLSPFIDFYC